MYTYIYNICTYTYTGMDDAKSKQKEKTKSEKKKQDRRLEKVLEMLKLKRHDWVVMKNYT